LLAAGRCGDRLSAISRVPKINFLKSGETMLTWGDRWRRAYTKWAAGDLRRGKKRGRARQFPDSKIATVAEVLEIRSLLSSVVTPAGTWTTLTNLAPATTAGIQAMLLLSDGRVMAQGGSDTASKNWYALTPDATGDYINGTWSSLKNMSLERLFFASNVLPSGKVFVLGGEYTGPNTDANFDNSGQIYDPTTNTWSNIPNYPQPNFGDDPTVVLPNGTILAGDIFTATTHIFDPIAKTWTLTGTKLRGDQSDEETWVMLPGGNVLSYDVFASPSSGPGSAQYYNASTGQWIDAGQVPVPLSGGQFGFELGPATLLPDGRVFQVGANGNNVLYDPKTNSWTQAPSTPGGFEGDDSPGAMLPNGHFIYTADSPPSIFTPPTKIFDYDPVNNTITDITPGGVLGSDLAGKPAFLGRMLVLPSGGVLLTTSSRQLYEFTPNGVADQSWAPTISSVTLPVGSSTFTLNGTQLTGLSEGASYGDDAEMSSNYPIVKITDSNGVVKYARSFNWTPGVATGSAVVSTNFTMPAGFGPGVYTLNVIANGISSTDFSLKILAPPTNVQATADSTNSAAVTWNAVQGADLGYQIYMVQGATNIQVGSAPAGATSAEALGLATSTANLIFVRALSSTYLPGQADSARIQVTTLAGLAAPTITAVTALSATTARVTWTNVNGANLGYQIYLKSTPTDTLLASPAAGTTTTVVSGLISGTLNKIYVRALSSTLSPFQKDSALFSIQMPVGVGTPTLSVTTNNTLATAVLNWTASTGAAGYRIYEKIGTQIFLVGVVAPNVLSYKVTGLPRGTTVSFMIEAFNSYIYSDSNWVTVNIGGTGG
jgi:hypothetical protein